MHFSKVIYDKNDNLLRFTLSSDGYYRVFTKIEDIPDTMKQALMLYEDRAFYNHFGFNPFSMIRAGIEMIFGSRKMGASTITMQLARLVYKLDTTSILGKLNQVLKAILIEIHYSKDEILEGYFNLAPYGHNIEGLGSASLIYFHKKPNKLTLPESLALAVIPQNPVKRTPTNDKGLKNMEEARLRLADIWIEEDKPFKDRAKLRISFKTIKDIPFKAPHFVNEIILENKLNDNIKTSLDLRLQEKIEDIVSGYIKRNSSYDVKNAAILLIDYQKMEVVSYIGSNNFFDDGIEGQVNGITALRSPGSLMKSFVYGMAIDEGLIHPMSLVKDIPKQFGVYTPENFDRKFMGALSATDALILSRNVPAVDLLLKLKKSSFYNILKEINVPKLKSEDYYGLALALGGFEISLKSTVELYAMLANLGEYREIGSENKKRFLSKEAAYLTLNMLYKSGDINEVSNFIKKKKQKIAWKTGTSYGFKDAWTVGIFGKYVLGVWIGNFDGKPNPAFVGRSMATPLFFEILRYMEKFEDFEDDEIWDNSLNLKEVDACLDTFDIASALCKRKVKSYVIPMKSPIKVSDIYRQIPININTGLRSCYHKKGETVLKTYEIWPSDIALTFEKTGIHKVKPPKFEKDCLIDEVQYMGKAPEIIFPTRNLIYTINPYKQEEIPFKANVDNDANKLFWFVNQDFVGTSLKNEALMWKAKVGKYIVTVTDDMGRKSDVVLNVEFSE